MKKLLRKLLEGLLPLDKILGWALKLGLLEKPLEWLGKGYKEAQGVRTQGSLAIAAALYVAALVGWVQWEQVDALIIALSGFAGAAFADKAGRIVEAGKKVSEYAKKETLNGPGDTSGQKFRLE